MSDPLFVEPGALRAAVAEVASATAALDRARGALDAAASSVDRALDPDQGAAHKVSTFARQWRAEYDIIAGFLDAYTDILTEAASAYEEIDAALTACLTEGR